MAKKRAKAQKRAKLRRGNSAKRGKARKASKSVRAKATKRTVAKAKPKHATAKKVAHKEVQPSALVVETVVVEKTIPDPIIVTGLDPAA
jgi:hypothetical protein